jgi:AhpD family alkylhydroperoxidase
VVTAADGPGVPSNAETPAPRVGPGTRADIGALNALITQVLGAAIGTGPPNLFTTLARHPRLFRRWLRFAGTLMPGGTLPRLDTELIILRVAHRCDCRYEWQHHQRIAAAAGLSEAQVAAVREGPDAAPWSAHERALLRAVDELFADRRVGDDTWEQLRASYTDQQLIELLVLIGHYEMLAGLINSLDIQPDALAPPTGTLTRLVGRLAARRAG